MIRYNQKDNLWVDDSSKWVYNMSQTHYQKIPADIVVKETFENIYDFFRWLSGYTLKYTSIQYRAENKKWVVNFHPYVDNDFPWGLPIQSNTKSWYEAYQIANIVDIYYTRCLKENG